MERMKVERNRAGNKYTFTPEDEKDEKFLDRIVQLEEENKKLREELSAYDREYFDEDKKAKNIFTEEGTLQ